MTQDEFERILVALANMRALNINGEHMVPLEGVIRVVHSNLHEEDRQKYVFDFQNNKVSIKKTPPSAEAEKG